MINKYAEIQERVLLYNAMKGILRVKMAAAVVGGTNTQFTGTPAGTVSNTTPVQQVAQTPVQPQKPLSRAEYFKMYGAEPVKHSFTDLLSPGGRMTRIMRSRDKAYNDYLAQVQSKNRQALLNQTQN